MNHINPIGYLRDKHFYMIDDGDNFIISILDCYRVNMKQEKTDVTRLDTNIYISLVIF